MGFYEVLWDISAICSTMGFYVLLYGSMGWYGCTGYYWVVFRSYGTRWIHSSMSNMDFSVVTHCSSWRMMRCLRFNLLPICHVVPSSSSELIMLVMVSLEVFCCQIDLSVTIWQLLYVILLVFQFSLNNCPICINTWLFRSDPWVFITIHRFWTFLVPRSTNEHWFRT